MDSIVLAMDGAVGALGRSKTSRDLQKAFLLKMARRAAWPSFLLSMEEALSQLPCPVQELCGSCAFAQGAFGFRIGMP